MGGDEEVIILGGGESGTGAAVLAKKMKQRVFLSDKGSIADKYKDVLSNHEVQWEEGSHDEERILNAGLIVKSPGIPDAVPLIVRAREKGIHVISEIEYAGRYAKGKIVAITGSNGKTTTTLLIGDMLQRGGLDVCVAGNVGSSFAAELAKSDHEFWVLELSSFQLDGIDQFKPDVAVLLNITPDHLDRYNNDFKLYANSKFRITMNQTEDDHFIYWSDDPVITHELQEREIKAKKYPFTANPPERDDWHGARANENEILIKTNNNLFSMSIHDLALKGKHNLFNSMASGVAGKILDLRKEVVRDSLTHFENVEHRLEFVAKVAGISFINDSKATNVNSTWYAMESMENPVIWIAGGVDKGNDYSDLLPLVQEKVKAIICLGTDNKKLHKAFGKHIETMIDVESADEAVQTAYQLGFKGDVVLLSPACASFDLFENFEERGYRFKAAVKGL